MISYSRKIEIRWSDLDINRHVANTSIMQYFIHARVGFLNEIGLNMAFLEKENIGPVILQEKFYYLKELHVSDLEAEVKLKNGGYSEDGRFVKIDQEMYTQRSGLSVYSTIIFVWLDLNTRKITKLPQQYFEAFKSLEHSTDFQILSRENLSIPAFIKH
jgi:acyl-CoA thioester hydrolase